MIDQNVQLGGVDLSQASDYKCELEGCHCDTFTIKYVIKKISALVSPNGQEAMVPIQVFACDLCGHINKEFRDSYLD